MMQQMDSGAKALLGSKWAYEYGEDLPAPPHTWSSETEERTQTFEGTPSLRVKEYAMESTTKVHRTEAAGSGKQNSGTITRTFISPKLQAQASMIAISSLDPGLPVFVARCASLVDAPAALQVSNLYAFDGTQSGRSRRRKIRRVLGETQEQLPVS